MEDPQPSHRELRKRLHQAAVIGDLEEVQHVLYSLEEEERNALLTSVEEGSGQLPFHGAARGGNMETLKLLLPESLRHLIDTPTSMGGCSWSCVHIAAAYGHMNVVEWLYVERRANLNLLDGKGNTPMHLAVVMGYKEVVRYLVTAGANLFSLNKQGMMPLSLCKDSAMFEAMFSKYKLGLSRGRPVAEKLHWPLDAEQRSILHYAAQFAEDPNRIMKLISETAPNQLQERDKYGDTFLHVAAKAGNRKVLQALKKRNVVNTSQLVSSSGSDAHSHSPGLCALLNNQREFFDELITMGEVKITLRCIIRGLMIEFIDKPQIAPRLGLLASSLPTYLALYANKKCIFQFLLETEIITLSQWDDEQKRTCLHWAVVDNRDDIVDQLCNDANVRPGIEDAHGKIALQLAFEQKNHMILDLLRSKRGFKAHEEKLDRDRDVYVQAVNGILVGATLIASVAFAGWLQFPSMNFQTLCMKIFWASNCISFFTAVATIYVSTTALVPTPRQYVGHIVKQLRVAIVINAGLLALSLVAVVCAFTAAGFAALNDVSHSSSYQGIMRITTALGGLLCFIVWIEFVFQLGKCLPSTSVLLALLLPSTFADSVLEHWWPVSFQRVRNRIGSSSRYGYPSSQLTRYLDRDLVTYSEVEERSPVGHVPSLPKMVCLETMQQVLAKLDMADTDSSFLTNAYQHRIFKGDCKQRKEQVHSSIMQGFGRL